MIRIILESPWTRHRCLTILIGRRKNADYFERQYRFAFIWGWSFYERRYVCKIETVPAWSEVPSVVAEYRRTMR
jgi:hypothetical protein